METATKTVIKITDLNTQNLFIFIPKDILGLLDIIHYVLYIGFYCEKHSWNHKTHDTLIKILKVKNEKKSKIR